MDDKNRLFYLSPYAMNHESRGKVLIFNNKEYPGYKDLATRKFNDADVVRLMKTVTSLGYRSSDIIMKTDRTADEIQNAIREVALEDHTNRDSIMVVFLAYGDDNLVYAKDRPVGLQILIDPLKGDICHPSLIGKPKIIMFQCCSITTYDIENDDSEEDAIDIKRVVSTESDFIILGSHVPALITNRDVTKGSLFIDLLGRQLQKKGYDLEIKDVMTRTMADIEQELDKWDPDWAMKNDQLLPYMVCMLTRELYFPDSNKA